MNIVTLLIVIFLICPVIYGSYVYSIKKPREAAKRQQQLLEETRRMNDNLEKARADKKS